MYAGFEGEIVMKPFEIGKVSCTLQMVILTWMVIVGSPAALAQSCVTVPPVPTECYDQISVQSGQFGWNWPPKGAILYCPDGVPTGAGRVAQALVRWHRPGSDGRVARPLVSLTAPTKRVPRSSRSLRRAGVGMQAQVC